VADHTHHGGETGPIINIRGAKIALGPLEKSLLPDYRRWSNDFETVRTLGAVPRPMIAEQGESWYDGLEQAELRAGVRRVV
jgi:hypothetical protein